jgi:HD-GYP domain-containing protein (c-di-GMP phosphodiesterase class II)
VFRELANDASDHHEKLDGRLPARSSGLGVAPTARILVVADIFEAMTAAQPYREPMPIGRMLSALAADAGSKLDHDGVAALHSWIELAAAA